jgi:hypothetical protein
VNTSWRGGATVLLVALAVGAASLTGCGRGLVFDIAASSKGVKVSLSDDRSAKHTEIVVVRDARGGTVGSAAFCGGGGASSTTVNMPLHKGVYFA